MRRAGRGIISKELVEHVRGKRKMLALGERDKECRKKYRGKVAVRNEVKHEKRARKDV